MKVFWLLFVISFLPFSANALRCTIHDNYLRGQYIESYYCIIKISEKDKRCIVSYNDGEGGYVGEKGIDNNSTWGERGCEIGKDGSVLCYCNDEYRCNHDILDFEEELQEAYNAKQDPKLREVSNCLRQATKQECAVGKPGEMVFEERLSDHSCFIKMVQDQGTYKVVELGQKIGTAISYCQEDKEEIQCYCNTYRCNIEQDGFSQDTLMNSIDVDQLGARAAPIAQFTSHIKTCGDSVASYDPNGTQSCGTVFKKNQNGTCTKHFAFVPNDPNRAVCFPSDPEDNEVTCVFEDDNSEGQKFLAEITMGRNGIACVELIPPTTSTPSTSTTTTTASTTSIATTSGTSSIAHSPSSLSQTEDSKSSDYFGLFIGAAAFNALTVVTIVALIIALIKMKKGGEAKQPTVKIEKAPKGSTAITIEKPVARKESSTVPPSSAAKPVVKKESTTVPPASNTNEANQREDAADKTTTGTGPSDLDNTGSNTDSDSTGPQDFSEVNWRVSGFNRN